MGIASTRAAALALAAAVGIATAPDLAAQSVQDRIRDQYETQGRQDRLRSFNNQRRLLGDAQRDSAARDRARAAEERRALQNQTDRNLRYPGGSTAPNRVLPD